MRKTVEMLFRSGLLILLLFAASTPARAFEPFVIGAIRVEGLQRISVGTVFNYLPLKRGDTVDEKAAANAVRALFKTGFFKDVVLEREGDTLVVFVAERPAIASIKIEGNDSIPSEQLMEGLKQAGLAEGRVFDRSMLDAVEQELNRQYLSMGKYGMRIKSTVTPMERNRVGIHIAIAEGEVARIHQVRIVGAKAFSEDALLDMMQSGVAGPFSLFSDRDEYSKQKLAGDLEVLRSYYMDRGYINFNIESTQVSITPDKRQVYITINLFEGERYHVKGVKIAGDTVVPEASLRTLISIQPGDVFSRREVTESSQRISERLGDEGFAFANVNPIPEVDKERREVSLTFFVDPGKRAYVRRINISGNVRTRDEVIRRELRQMEAAWLSTSQVQRSRTRLDRLGYFSQVNVKTPTVPGTPDQVDVDFDLVERETFGSLNFGIGYGDSQGFLVSASVTEENFLGTGKRFTLAVNNSKVNTVYDFSFTDPYYTLDGVSRRLNVFYRTTDAGAANVTDYTTDSYGAGIGYGIPLSEFRRASFGLNFEHTRLNTSDSTSGQVLDFVADNGNEFDAYKLDLGWTHDSRNRAFFPTSGTLLSLGADVTLPGANTLDFYKLSLRHKTYVPLTDKVTFSVRDELAYGNSYGDTTVLPPFEKYYAGGTRTVRGYRGNSLGPKDDNGDPLGGNARIVGNLELIFPAPFADNSDSVRLSAFVDVGNVFDTKDKVDLSELRSSAGMSLMWFTPVGPLTFSLAKTLNDKPGDTIERFQFNLGMPF